MLDWPMIRDKLPWGLFLVMGPQFPILVRMLASLLRFPNAPNDLLTRWSTQSTGASVLTS